MNVHRKIMRFRPQGDMMISCLCSFPHDGVVEIEFNNNTLIDYDKITSFFMHKKITINGVKYKIYETGVEFSKKRQIAQIRAEEVKDNES